MKLFSMFFKARLDTTELDQDVDEAEARVRRLTAQMVTDIRKSAELGIALYQAFGGVIDQSYALAIQAGLRSLELYTTIAAAGKLTPLGWVRIGAQALAIAAMLRAIAQLQAGRNEAAQQTMLAVRVLQLATWR